MAVFANATGDKLATLRTSGKTVQSDQLFGGLGRWPNEPIDEDIICELVRMEVKPDEKFTFWRNNKKEEVPAFTVRFHYNWLDDPEGPLAWGGQYYTIPYDIGSLPESDDSAAGGKKQTMCNMHLARLKGSLEGFLEDDFIDDDIVACIELANDKLEEAEANGTSIMVTVFKKFETQEWVAKSGAKKGEKQTRKVKLESIRGLA